MQGLLSAETALPGNKGTRSFLPLQVVVISKTAVGVGGHCNESEHEDRLQCEWDSISYMQNEYTSGHRRLLLDCLGVTDETSKPSQQQTKVTIVQRLMAKGRSMLNVLEMQSAIAATGAEVQIVNMEGVLCVLFAVVDTNNNNNCSGCTPGPAFIVKDALSCSHSAQHCLCFWTPFPKFRPPCPFPLPPPLPLQYTRGSFDMIPISGSVASLADACCAQHLQDSSMIP